jgi:hypothetical protein
MHRREIIFKMGYSTFSDEIPKMSVRKRKDKRRERKVLREKTRAESFGDLDPKTQKSWVSKTITLNFRFQFGIPVSTEFLPRGKDASGKFWGKRRERKVLGTWTQKHKKVEFQRQSH